ncbi:DUF2178 domain-containing protein [Halostagnicola sp. A-GB9-2]|uniref:DUF2178 domain-containing protein n=1 Tax=Halostagnicola sp. A-GB9-2 TaxID=3048066 RepID=UPI0024BF34A1|nr:DUF2178 domain-containing protein [Halostagnicola sp. A-GB9-2]MDJ1434646.1 DUF2178 domain-containing protein [Halostagnicola sp. A-GB9-2]
MSDTTLPTVGTPERTRKVYERTVYAIFAVAIIGLLAGLVFNQEYAGTVIYLVGVWLGVGLAYLLPKWSDVRFDDERDEEIFRQASGLAMSVAFVVGLGVVPAVYVLGAAGHLTITSTMWGAIYAASAMYLVWGACYTIVSRRL